MSIPSPTAPHSVLPSKLPDDISPIGALKQEVAALRAEVAALRERACPACHGTGLQGPLGFEDYPCRECLGSGIEAQREQQQSEQSDTKGE